MPQSSSRSSSSIDDFDAQPGRVARRKKLLRARPPGTTPEVSASGPQSPSPTSSDTDAHEGRTRFNLPLAPIWGPLPERRPRRVRIWPMLQERGPSPVRAPSPVHDWADTWPDNGWRFDAHPAYSGWNASAAGHGAALLMNAAYGAASEVSHNISQVDFRWHTPEKGDVKPLGYNEQGDLASLEVHAVLDVILARKELDPAVHIFIHRTMDLCWMLHSRAVVRCPLFLRQLNFFTELEAAQLARAMYDFAFDDGRLLMSALDPREKPIYGRTRDSPGSARIYRMFPYLRRERETATWDKDDGGASGSSDCSLTRPFERTPDQTIEHLKRHHQRRLRHAVEHADHVEKEIARVEAEVRGAEERLRALLVRQESVEGMINIFDSGLNALAPLQSESWRAKLGLRPATPDAEPLESGSTLSWPSVSFAPPV